MILKSFQRGGIYLAAFMLAPLPALASLGGNTASVNQDIAALHGNAPSNTSLTAARSMAMPSNNSLYKMQEFTTEDGTKVREYIYNDNVFGIAWNGPVIPDLSQLFGSVNYTNYRNSLQNLEKSHSMRSSHRAVSVSEATLVVHSYGSVPNFKGNAYIPQLVPAGTSVTDIK